MPFFDVHTHKNRQDKNVFSIVNTYPNSSHFSEPFSIGIHPWFINKENVENELFFVEKKLQHKNCFALGECGLDKLTKADFNLQTTVFKKQIALSEKYKKPVILHCVRSFQKIIKLKKELDNDPKKAF